VTTGEQVPEAAVGGSRRVRAAFVLVVVLALVVGAVVVGLPVIDRRYGPPQPGSFGGVLTPDAVGQASGGNYRLEDPTGTVDLLESLSNQGGHSIMVTGVDDPAVTSVRWSEYRFAPGGYVSGVDTPWRGLAATVPAHATIRLRLTVCRPAPCGPAQQAGDGGVPFYTGSHAVRWRSLLRSHRTVLTLSSWTLLC